MKLLKYYNKFISCLLIACVLSFSVGSAYAVKSVEASGTVQNALQSSGNLLVKLFLTANGVVARSGITGISSVSTSVQNALLDEVENQLNLGGIYESNGKIIFNSSAMSALYALLGGTDSARAISDFTRYDLYYPPSMSGYATADYIQSVANIVSTCKSSGQNYLFMSSAEYHRYSNKDYNFLTFNAFILNDNVAFVRFPASGTPYFYNFNGNKVSVQVYETGVSWENSVADPITSTGPNSRNYINVWNDDYDMYDSFPVYDYATTSNGNPYNYYYNFYSNTSLLICKDVVGGNALVNQSSGNMYFKNYDVYEIDSDTFYNNNWNNIYNNYVTNVTNTYNTEVETNNGDDLTANDIRKIMNMYLQNIYVGIDQGLDDIEDKISYINEWLSKIYDNTSLTVESLQELIDLLSEGGSGCVWTEDDVTLVKQKLTAIYGQQVSTDADIIAALTYIKDRLLAIQNLSTNIDTLTTSVNSNSAIIVDSLDTELSRLATIINKLDTIIGKIGGTNINIPSIDPDIIDDINDILDSDLLDDVFNPFSISIQIFQQVIPVCYIFVAKSILTALRASPMTPRYEIPIKIQRFNIDQTLVIDLSQFDTLASFIRAFFLLAVAFGLCFFTVNLVRNILQILN